MKTIFSGLIALLMAVASTAAVVLEWDPNKETNIVGYTLKWGFTSGAEDHDILTGLNTTWTVSEPWPSGTVVYFVVTATNVEGLESGPSNEISYTVPAAPTPTPAPSPTPVPAPSPPTNLRIKLTLTFELWYAPGSQVQVLAPPAPPGYKWSRWDGDVAILSSFLDRKTNATIPYMDVELTVVYLETVKKTIQ
jgi:hypothetical protein